MYKYCNKHFPSAFERMLNTRKNTLLLSRKESCQTRSKSNFFPYFLFCTIDLNKQSLSYRGPLIWNKIPPTIRENKSFTSFTCFALHAYHATLVQCYDSVNRISNSKHLLHRQLFSFQRGKSSFVVRLCRTVCKHTQSHRDQLCVVKYANLSITFF